ncbi:MAG: hypothetical protein ACYCUV_03980 [Phycisphaerae bacterium]
MRYILWSIVALLLLAVAMIGQVWLSNPATMGRPQWRAGDVVVGRVGHIAMRHAPSAVRPETPFSMSSALRRQAASEAKSLEVVFRQCRKITRNIKGPGRDARRRAALRRYEGKLVLARWIDTAPKSYRKSLRQWVLHKHYAQVATAAFSPRRRERAGAVDKLQLINDKCSTWLLDALLMDDSRYVRLKALNAFWARGPDALGVRTLFWMAACTGYVPFDLGSGTFAWHLPTGRVPSTWLVDFHGKSVAAVGGTRTVVYPTDQRRACQILLHWQPQSLGKWLVKALTYGMTAVREWNFGVNSARSTGLCIQNWNNYRSLFESEPPPAAAPYLLGMLEGLGSDMNESLVQGQKYYSNAFTEPLCLLFVDEHLNPTHFGLVTVPQGSWHGVSVPRFIYPGQQALAINYMKECCHKRGIPAAHVSIDSPNPTSFAPVILAFALKQLPGLFGLKCGLINWYRWALHRPARSQSRMLDWGSKRSAILYVSMVFSREGKSQLCAAYALQLFKSSEEMRILAHLLDGNNQAASLAAMNVFWKVRPDAVVARAIWRRATVRDIPPWLPKRANSPLTWTFNFHQRQLIIYKQIQGVAPDESGTVILHHSRAASELLVRWRPKGIESRLISAAKSVAQTDTGPLSHALGPDGKVGQNLILICRRYAGTRLVPYLLTDLKMTSHGNWFFGPFEGKTGYADERTDPLVMLCNLAGKKPEKFGLQRPAINEPVQPLQWDSASKTDEDAGIAAMEKYWAARGIYAAKLR